MKAEDLLGKVLNISPPWSIVRIREDMGKHQIDVWIAKQTAKGGWFFGNKTAEIPSDKEVAWRHVNLDQVRCVIHALPCDEMPPPHWMGETGMPFTHAMSATIASMIREGVKLQSICNMLDITVADLWKFKHTIDSGKSALPPGVVTTVTETESPAGSSVPRPDAVIWQQLLEGSVNIEIRVLGLKFLLTKLREQMRVITDSEVRKLKAYELQSYFVRYEQMLGHELAQLKKLS